MEMEMQVVGGGIQSATAEGWAPRYLFGEQRAGNDSWRTLKQHTLERGYASRSVLSDVFSVSHYRLYPCAEMG